MESNNKRIAIVTASNNTYSETFIKAQIDFLPADIVLHTGTLPTIEGEGNLILSRFKSKINIILHPFLKRDIFQLSDAIGKLIIENKIDLVLVQYGVTGAKMLPICKKFNIPMVVHFHGYDASIIDVLEKYKEEYLEMFNYSKAIIVVSKVMKKSILNLGCPEHKLYHLTYGYNPIFNENKPQFEKDTFFFVGRYVNKKAPYITVLAFKELLLEFPNAKLRMGGNGELLNTCKNIVKIYNLENNVEFLGVLNPEDVKNEMQNALAYVQHSVVAENGDSEGTPLAVLEAQAAALPVISTYHAGIQDVVIDEVTGFLVDEFDIKKMTESMKKLLENKNLAKSMGIEGRNRVAENFTMQLYIEKLQEIINQ